MWSGRCSDGIITAFKCKCFEKDRVVNTVLGVLMLVFLNRQLDCRLQVVGHQTGMPVQIAYGFFFQILETFIVAFVFREFDDAPYILTALLLKPLN